VILFPPVSRHAHKSLGFVSCSEPGATIQPTRDPLIEPIFITYITSPRRFFFLTSVVDRLPTGEQRRLFLRLPFLHGTLFFRKVAQSVSLRKAAICNFLVQSCG